MSPEERFQAFKAAVITKDLFTVQATSFTTFYHRLVLTRRLLELIISILLIFGGQLFVIQNGFFCPVWAGTGVALSAIFLRGNFLLVGIFLGSISSYLYNHYSLLQSILLSILFTAYIYLIRQCCLRFIGPVTPFAETKVLWKFIVVIGILTALDVSLIFLLLDSIKPLNLSFSNFFLAAYWGQLNGILCITPLCLIFEPFIPERYFQKTNWQWKIGVILIIACQFLVYVFPQCLFNIGLALFSAIFLFFFGKQYGQFPTGVALLGISVVYLGANHCQSSLLFFLLTLTSIIALYSATKSEEKI